MARWRGFVIGVAAGVLFAGVAACSVTNLVGYTAAERSLAQIQINGYPKTGHFDDPEPGTTDSSGVYVGPPASNSDLAKMMIGPGVFVEVFPRPSPNVATLPSDNTVRIGRGNAPLGCGLLIYKYRKGKSASDWWNITDSQLARARAGRLGIFEVTVVCGKG